jgi:ribosomal protein L11 methyltransferase
VKSAGFFMNKYVQATIEVDNDEEREVLIAELIIVGFESFEEDPKLLKAFVTDAAFDESAFRSLIQQRGKKFKLEAISEKNWNEEWERNFQPVVIGDFCAVRAAFHEPIVQTKHEIIITPKMSFGTGHHATTHLMLELMGEEIFTNLTVLDFGTGTGILSIMAEKLGASAVLAIDIDEWSIENAAENLHMNNCRNTTLEKRGNIPLNASFNRILANINRNVILDSLPDMCKVLQVNGAILLSGLLQSDFEQINVEATSLGLQLQRKGEKSGWIALRYNLLS